MRNILRTFTAAAAVTLMAACGGDTDDDAFEDTAPATAPAPMPETTPPPTIGPAPYDTLHQDTLGPDTTMGTTVAPPPTGTGGR